MSPEDETTASPPAGLIAGREEEERRVSSPPSGSKFLDDQKTDTSIEDSSTAVTATAAMIQRGAYDDATSTDDEKDKASFASRKCPTKESFADDSWGTSDVEKFDGKIVYNPDGSAYIIEDSELSEDDAELPQIIGDGCIVDGPGVNLSQVQALPQIANAFYVSRNPALYTALYGGYANKLVHDKKIVPEAPIMHSYRVYTVRDNRGGDCNEKLEEKKQNDCSSVPVKPILMCFICKLSFGYAKSFVAHAMGDHNVVLRDDEKDILGHKNASAIIQCVGKEKEPLVSFLEPLSPVIGTATSTSTSTTTTDGKSSQLLRRSSSPGYSEAESQNVPKDPVPSAVDGSSEFDDEKVCAESLVVHQRDSSPKPVHTHNVPETLVSLPQNGSCVNMIKDNISSSSSSSSNRNNIITSVSSLSGRESSGLNCVMDLTRKSPISASAAQTGNAGGRGSSSPGASPSPGTTLSPLLSSAVPYPQPPPNFLTGTTIGVCPDHMGGRPSGVECAKCELILSSSRLGGVGGPLAGMHSRNSCKTLKCPKCNWHYKYQETLEIHMKEKHPETETSCIYCIAGQPHPRLARGETYTCGYKPYRCEVCNYSTTTKGNLSIHMQSDKHLNNMQELQNGGGGNSERLQQTPPPSQHKPTAASPVSGGAHHPGHSPISSQQSQKPKPTFRCDVCNYETNVARNLRIHMTSEKHTHNMMVLQQNVKHMQTLSAIQQSHHQQQLGFESLLHFHPGLAIPGGDKPPHAEAAMADMAYNQALLIQMMTGGQLPPHLPPELAPHMDMGLNPETMEPPPEPADPNPDHLFHCCVCNNFSTDSLEALTHHLAADRTKIREQEILAVVAGHYVCKLCTYKTNLKANFQLHCKTDKHLQRLQHVNHVKEGGPRNEWKLKYLSSPGGVQVRCHACDYYTNSAHKLQLHSAGQRHEVSSLLFRHIRESDGNVYRCNLCGFSSRARLPLLQHARSMKHLQMEQLHQLQRRSEGKEMHADISEVFQVLNQPTTDSDFEQGIVGFTKLQNIRFFAYRNGASRCVT